MIPEGIGGKSVVPLRCLSQGMADVSRTPAGLGIGAPERLELTAPHSLAIVNPAWITDLR